MSRFHREECGQNTNDVMLVAQSKSEKESFSFFTRVFGNVAEEIKSLESDGVVVRGKNLCLLPLLDCDMMALYKLSGISGPNAAQY